MNNKVNCFSKILIMYYSFFSEVHQTVILHLKKVCVQLLHYYSVSEAYIRSATTAADTTAGPPSLSGHFSPDLSHDNSNLDGFIDDSFWLGAAEPTSLPSLELSKMLSIVTLLEKYDQEILPAAASGVDQGEEHGSTCRLRENLTSFPHLVACLTGQWAKLDLDGLGEDVQEMIISLQASAGMLNVMQLAKHTAAATNDDEGLKCHDPVRNAQSDNNVENDVISVDRETQCGITTDGDLSESVQNPHLELKGDYKTETCDDGDMTMLKPKENDTSLPVQEEIDAKIFRLNAEIANVLSDNHRLQGICSGLQSEKKNLLDELECMEKYSAGLSQQLKVCASEMLTIFSFTHVYFSKNAISVLPKFTIMNLQ